jgi:hypothetical protein
LFIATSNRNGKMITKTFRLNFEIALVLEKIKKRAREYRTFSPPGLFSLRVRAIWREFSLGPNRDKPVEP